MTQKNIAGFKLEVTVNVKGFNALSKDFLPTFKKGIALLKTLPAFKKSLNGGEIQLVFTDDQEIKLINGRYRKKNKPTDVVSLSYFENKNFPQENLLGEIIISVDTARKQAREQGHSLKKELQFLFAHGLLHIFGFDHENEAERKAMFKLQDEILA